MLVLSLKDLDPKLAVVDPHRLKMVRLGEAIMHIEYVRGKIMWREVFYEGLAIVRGHHWATIDTGEPLEEVSILVEGVSNKNYTPSPPQDSAPSSLLH